MAVTSLGKILRKIRIDHNEVLQDMAEKLGVTASFLSAVENGKRNVPASWLDQLPSVYSLSEQSADALRQAARTQMKFVKLELDKANEKRDEVVFAFARKIEELDDTVLDELKKILAKGREQND